MSTSFSSILDTAYTKTFRKIEGCQWVIYSGLKYAYTQFLTNKLSSSAGPEIHFAFSFKIVNLISSLDIAGILTEE